MTEAAPFERRASQKVEADAIPRPFARTENRGFDVKQIVVADSSPDINRLLQIILENEWVRVHTANNADSVIRIAAANRIDAFIISAGLAGPQGTVSLHDYLCQAEPFRKIPILLVSGALGSISTSTLRKKRAAGFIAKPFTIQEVKKEVLRILEEIDKREPRERASP